MPNKSFPLFKSIGISRVLPKTRKRGESPGTVGYIGQKPTEPVSLELIDYNYDHLTEKIIKNLAEVKQFQEQNTITWLNIVGVHSAEIIQKIGEMFHPHPLILEDIANTTQRPKAEDYEDYLFVVLKMAYFEKKQREVQLEQISIIIGKNYVITFQEKRLGILNELRSRIRLQSGRIRKMGSDYLAYGIIDSIIDHYFFVMEEIGVEIDVLEEELIDATNQHIPNLMYKLKKEIMFLRKSIWPMRDVIKNLEQREYKTITPPVAVYLRDVHDHIVQIIETMETFREMVSNMLELYLSSVSNKLNEVMKVLTVFTAIFIPLTFIAGVYGMNFEYMPELKMRWGYFILLGCMALIALALTFIFRKKKWL